MKQKRKMIRIATIALFFAFSMYGSVYAQNSTSGEISGILKDLVSKQTISYATIVIKGTSVGTVTDMDGEFRLTNLKPADYTLLITYVGYKPKEIKVTVKSGENKKMQIDLDQAMVAIGEVEVTAQRTGQNAAINQQLNSNGLVNVISKDKIRDLPDVTVAEAIGRLPGVTLQRSGGEGSKIVLRGLDPKFSNISINGVKQAATDPNNRSVDLSGISPELLSGIEVYKSPTADMDGDAFGGTINLVVSKAPDRAKNQFRLYGGYAGLDQQIGNHKGSWDFSQRFLDKKLGLMIQANYENTARNSEALNVAYHQPDQSTAESLKNLYVSSSSISRNESQRKRIGGNMFVDYQFDMGSIYLSGMYNSSPRHGYSQSQSISKSGEMLTTPRVTESVTNTLNTTIGGKLNLKLAKIDWSYNRVQTKAEEKYDMELVFKTDAPYALKTGQNNKNDITDYNMLWDSLAVTSTNGAIDQKTYLERAFWTPGKTNQTNNSAKIDIEIPIKIGSSIGGFVKIGGKYAAEKRDRFSRTTNNPFYYLMRANDKANIIANSPTPLEFRTSGQISSANFTTADATKIIDGRYEFYPNIDESKVREWETNHNKPGEMNYDPSSDHNNYETYEQISAGYLMMKLNYREIISLVPGLRVENTNSTYYGYFSTIGGDQGTSGSIRPDTSTQNYTEILPSIHLKIKPTKWLDLRLSAVKTFSRPDYLWLLPRFKYTAEQNSVGRSNPDLKHATSWNYDASLTAYTGEFGMLSIGGYYKDISNMFYAQNDGTMSMEEAIKLGLPPRPVDLNESYINLPKAWVKGIEFDYTTHFNFLPSPFNRFALGVNVTRLWSETTYKKWNRVDGLTLYKDIRPVMSVDFTKSYYKEVQSAMPSQADYTGNLWLGYDYKKLSCRVSSAYQGYRLSGINVNSESVADQNHVNHRLSFDATVKYEILKSLHVLFNANNISNAPDQNYRYTPDYLTSKTLYGSTFDIGIQYNFSK